MDSETEGMIVHKAEMLEMDYLRSLGIEPNFADVSRHMEDVLDPFLEREDLQDEIATLEADNEELEDKLDSIEDYAARMRKQLKGMDFEGKGEIEAILSDIEGELGW